jgi:hypothetical protein
MCNGFFKFPRTPHLKWLTPSTPGEDRVLDDSAAKAFLSAEILVEEKVDGANVGLSLGSGHEIRVQNRGSWVEQGAHPQFQPIWSWIAARRAKLISILEQDVILFGEWCFAVHSVRYDRLPDWFLAFDVYDCEAARFWSSSRRNELAQSADIAVVPQIERGSFAWPEVYAMLDHPSGVSSGSMEGVYLRAEDDRWLHSRAKLVAPDFLAGMATHWAARMLERNRLAAHRR